MLCPFGVPVMVGCCLLGLCGALRHAAIKVLGRAKIEGTIPDRRSITAQYPRGTYLVRRWGVGIFVQVGLPLVDIESRIPPEFDSRSDQTELFVLFHSLSGASSSVAFPGYHSELVADSTAMPNLHYSMILVAVAIIPPR